MKNAVELEGVTVHYGQVLALDNINLIIREKEFMGIIGPNGGGKSSLLRVIGGLVKPGQGKVRVLGMPPCRATGRIGYVPQHSNINKQFPINVTDAVLSGCLQNHGLFLHRYTQEDLRATEKILQQLEIQDLADRQIGALSGGQMQRVLIARALVMNPEILLLDEPTASLDAQSRSSIYDILKDLNHHMTIIMVTHDMGVISSHVTQIACLNTEMFYHGEPELNNEILDQVYGCPVDLIAHGVPHRVLHHHKEDHHHD